MIWLLAGLGAFAQDPGPPGDVFGDQNVRVEIVGDQWRITVRGRVLEVAVPETEDDRALVEALVTSLLAELSLAPRTPPPPPSVPVPAPVRLAPPAPTPASPEPEAPAAPAAPAAPMPTLEPTPPPPDERELPLEPISLDPPTQPTTEVDRERGESTRSLGWDVWVAGAAVFRAQLAGSGGPGLGVHLGRTRGVRARIAVELPRATRFVEDSRVRAVQLDVAAWWAFGPIHAELGPGISMRNYRVGEEAPTRHVAPVVTAGIGVPIELGQVTVSPWLGATADAAVTRLDLPGEDEAVLSPVQGWVELRIGWRP